MTADVDVSKLPGLKNFSGLLSDRVYLALRDAILSMDFAPGNVVRKEPICSHLEVSRQPVSDALRKLSDEGLVDVVPQSGTRVSKLSMNEIREGAALREALEVAAVARAAEFRSEAQMSKLTRNIRMQKLLVEDQDFEEFFKSDEEFHETIMESSGISMFATTVQTVSLQVKRARLLMLPKPGRLADTFSEHEAIVEAIQKQDSALAESVMRRHLRQLLDRLESLERERPELFVR